MANEVRKMRTIIRWGVRVGKGCGLRNDSSPSKMKKKILMKMFLNEIIFTDNLHHSEWCNRNSTNKSADFNIIFYHVCRCWWTRQDGPGLKSGITKKKNFSCLVDTHSRQQQFDLWKMSKISCFCFEWVISVPTRWTMSFQRPKSIRMKKNTQSSDRYMLLGCSLSLPLSLFLWHSNSVHLSLHDRIQPHWSKWPLFASTSFTLLDSSPAVWCPHFIHYTHSSSFKFFRISPSP